MEALRVIAVDDVPLALKRLRIICGEIEDIVLVGCAAGCSEALDLVARTSPDVMLLDIRMRDGTGFDLLDRLPDDIVPAVIFVTAFDTYATRAFEVRAVDYVLKPVDLPRLRLAFDRARDALDAQNSVERVRELRQLVAALRAEMHGHVPAKYEREFWIRRNVGGYLRIAAEEIDSVSAEGDYVKIRAGSREYLMRETLTGLHARLDPTQFVRIHRSTLVRLGALAEFKRGASGSLEAQLRDGTRFPVGRIYAKSLRRFISVA